MIRKYKKLIVIFLFCFIFYFIIGTLLSYYLDSVKYWNVLLDLDTPRVLGDLSLKVYDHYRSTVHPLFIIIFQPMVYILKQIVQNPIIAILLIQSTIGATSSVIFYTILKKITAKKENVIVFAVLFIFNFAQILFSSLIETYIYAQLFLMALWLYVFYKVDNKLNLFDYIIITVLGVFSIAVTITNFFQFLIAIFFLILLNKNVKKRFLICFIIILSVVSITISLAELQNVLWPSAPNFFSKNLLDLLNGGSSEKLYITKSIGIRSIYKVLDSNFSQLFSISNLNNSSYNHLSYNSTLLTKIVSAVMGLSFLLINIYFVIKTKFNIIKYKIYYSLAFVYAFNFILHLFYGNQTAFIYICHYNFIIIFLLAYLFNYFDINAFKNRIVRYTIIILFVALSFKNIVMMFKYLFSFYERVEHFSIWPFIIIGLTILLIVLILLKKKHYILFIVPFIVAGIIFAYKSINKVEIICTFNCGEYNSYFESLDKYKKQLRQMRNELSGKYYYKRYDPINIFFFGMADRTKILYKDGKLINMKNKEVIKEIEYKDFVIVPNEYTVLLNDEYGNNYKIYENEYGIFFQKNDVLETIYKGNKKINLPEFDENKYSEILKVSHQEILFNIDGDTPKPNIIYYNDAWYRDTMLTTMVLEETNNVNLLDSWVNKIDSIYDFQRSPDIKEADNLGELLYIIGATGSKRKDLINEIIVEINNLKKPNKTISGMVDGVEQTYYPTLLALYGAEKVGISLDLEVPKVDDAYAKLTWYYDEKPSLKGGFDTRIFPYIDWASYHYDHNGSLYILDEIYPLSYEGGIGSNSGPFEEECYISQYYCEQRILLSHIWHASEMFLLLEEY